MYFVYTICHKVESYFKSLQMEVWLYVVAEGTTITLNLHEVIKYEFVWNNIEM